MRFLKRLAIGSFLAAIVGTCRAATLTGVVKDAGDVPMAGVQVVIPALQLGTKTDASGAYKIENVPPGQYAVEYRVSGSPAVTKQADLTKGDTTLSVSVSGSPLELAPITITAKPEAASTLTTPSSVDVVQGRQLEKIRGQNVMDTIKDLPGVDVLTTGSTLSRPVVEGLSEQNVVMVEDGVRHEVQPWGIEHAPMIDSLTTDRIEVLRGPASLLYGSDALGGVISVFKPELPSAALGAGAMSGKLVTTVDSVNGAIGTAGVVQGAQGDWGYRADASQQTTGNEYTPSGTIPNTGSKEASGDGTIGVKKDWGSLIFDYGHVHKMVQLQEWSLSTGGGWANPLAQDTEFQVLDHDKASVKATINTTPARYDIVAGFDRENRREFGANDPVSAEFPVVQWVQNNYYLDLKAHHEPLGPIQGTIGLTGWLRDQTSAGPQPLIPGFDQDSAGEYVFEELPVGPVTFSAGIRADQNRFDIHGKATDLLGTHYTPSQTLDYSALTGALGGVWHISDPLAFAVNVGRGYRNPIPFELFAYGVHEGTGRFEIGDPSLSPETSLNTDASLRYVSKRLRGEVMYYHNIINNFIYSAPASAAVQAAVPAGDNPDGDPIFQQTQGNAVLQGGSISGDADVTDFLRTSAGFDITRGNNTSISQPLPIIPADRVRLGAELHGRSLCFLQEPYFGANVKHVFTQNRTAQDFPNTPVEDYTLLGLTWGGQLNLGGNRVTVDMGLNNLLNVGYQDILNVYRAFGIEMPGRNLFVKMSVPFGA